MDGPAPLTLASTLYDRIRADVLNGRFKPRSKLQIRLLMEEYGAGQTPLREALNRLAAEGLVTARDQRGFVVTAISADELRELTKTRCWLEGIALRESMAAASAEWEERLVIAGHRLLKTPRSLSEDRFESNPEWEPVHRAFHRALIAGCGSRPLIGFCEDLADQLHRYRQLSIQRAYPRRKVREEHEAILRAVIDGDAELAVSLLTAHYHATADVILADETLFGD